MKTLERIAVCRTSIQGHLNDIFEKLEENPESIETPIVRDTLEQLMVKLARFSSSLD